MSCIPILTSASTPFIPGKSRMRKRARTDLCGGGPAMVVPTATVNCFGFSVEAKQEPVTRSGDVTSLRLLFAVA